MVVECGHCGAPLDIEEGRSVVSCAYCKKKNQVATLKTVAATTPADFKAPEVWKPSETSEPLAYRPTKSSGGKAGLILGAIALGIAGVVYGVHMQGATIDDVAKMPLDGSPDRIEKDLHVTYRTDDGLRVTFRSGAAGPYEHLFVRWEEKDFSLVSQLSLFVVEGSRIGPNVVPTLEKALPGGLDESGRWAWGPASLNVDLATGALHVNVHPTKDATPGELRKRRLTVLWAIARSAAFGGAMPPNEEIAAALGGGLPLTKVGALDTSTTFSAARSAVPKLLPGTLADDTTFSVPLEHPLLRAVALRWDNAADGRLRGAHFRIRPAFGKRLDGFVACLTKENGPPETHVSDFAAGKRSSVFQVRGGDEPGAYVTMHVGDEANLYINSAGQSYEQSAWTRAFEVLERCR